MRYPHNAEGLSTGFGALFNLHKPSTPRGEAGRAADYESTAKKPSRASRLISACSSSETGAKFFTFRLRLKLCHSLRQCVRYAPASSNSAAQAEHLKAFLAGCCC